MNTDEQVNIMYERSTYRESMCLRMFRRLPRSPCLQGKMILDTHNGLPFNERPHLIDCNGFFRLLAFMLDSNFAGIRERSEEIAAAPSGIVSDFE